MQGSLLILNTTSETSIGWDIARKKQIVNEIWKTKFDFEKVDQNLKDEHKLSREFQSNKSIQDWITSNML
jgi:hypothetical protein